MKKWILSMLIVAIVSFSITGILIVIKNSHREPNSYENEIPSESKEKTLDLDGTFHENDLLVEKIPVTFEEGDSVEIPQIIGLKNKQVEDKVNTDMEMRIKDKIKEIKENGAEGIYSMHTYNIYYKGFSNVISFDFDFQYLLNDQHQYENVYLNYELVTGERLKFEDLFAKGTDILNIIRRAYYRDLAATESNLFEKEDDIYFDKEKNMWIGLQEVYDEASQAYVEKYQEYVPYNNEYDIYKRIQKFMKDKEEFYFTPSRLFVGGTMIEFRDIAENVVIYDKYLTEESLFESDSIGQKHLFTCATVRTHEDNVLQQDYGLAEENLFYEIMAKEWDREKIENPYQEAFVKRYEETMEESQRILEEYQELARKNPDKFYVVYLEPSIDCEEAEEPSYLLTVTIQSRIAELAISEKEELLHELRDCYRYYNLDFYGNSGMRYALSGGCAIFSEKDIDYYTINKKETKKEYDIRT